MVRETGSHHQKPFWRIIIPLAALNLLITLIVAFSPQHIDGTRAPDHWDFSTYYRMAQDWPNHDFHLWNGELDHQFPPFWPMLLSAFTILPGGVWTVFVASILLNVAAMLVMIILVRRMFDHKFALTLSVLILLLPYFAIANMDGFSDTLTSLTYLTTIIALTQSLTKERMVRWAGFYASLTYLLKASMGYFIIIAAGSGIVWRLRHKGIKGITSLPYLQAILIFGLIAGPWVLRNILDFGLMGWETQPYMTDSIIMASSTHEFWAGIGLTFLTAILVMALPTLIIVAIQIMRNKTWNIRLNEKTELLLVSIILPLLIGVIAAAAFDWREGRPYNDGNLIRYIMPTIMPLLWLIGTWTGETKEDKPIGPTVA